MKSLKVIKEGIINKNEEVCVENLKILFLENKHNFTNTLLKSNILPEPISYKTKNEDIEFCNKLFTRLAIELLNHDDVTINDINIITGFKLALYTIFKGIRINAKLLENNEISKMTSYAEKIKIPLVYLQYNSYMLTKVREKEKLTEKNFITFFEGEIKNKKAEKCGNTITSLSDSYELEVEMIDLLIKFVYSTTSTEEISPSEYQNIKISPFYKPWFESLQYISRDRKMLEKLWVFYKYDKWNYSPFIKNNITFHYFSPNNKEEYKRRQIGIKRRIYKEIQNFGFLDINKQKLIKSYSKIKKEIRVFSNISQIFYLHTDMLKEVVLLIEKLVANLLENLDDIYLKLEKESFSVSNYIKGFTYLLTMSSLYEKLIDMFNKADEENSQYYITELSLEILATQFSRIYPEISKKNAIQILNEFVFNGSRNNEDIFMKPLIKMYQNVVFTPVLISRFVLERALQFNISKYKFDISKRGFEFEENLKLLLSLNSQINIINKNKMKFIAYDEKEVEFDLLFTFEDFLIMIELKKTMISYDIKEYFDTKNNVIKEAENQIKRRIGILNKDWEKIRKSSSINLCETPYAEDKIINIVCTNIFDFSGNYENGVYFIDDSILLKFFLDPYERFFELKNGLIVEKVKEKHMFTGKSPTIKDFLDYLKNPNVISIFDNCWKEQIIPVCKIEENEIISTYDLGLIEDPYAKKIKENINI